MSSSHRHTIVVDWDGTLVPSMWPEQPSEFMPGAVQAMFQLHNAGFRLMVFSARLSPFDPVTHRTRPKAVVAQEYEYVRGLLDEKGLTFVDIWRLPGKAPGSVYVDDKAIRYTGRPGSWRAVTEKVLALLKAEEPRFPAFDQDRAEES